MEGQIQELQRQLEEAQQREKEWLQREKELQRKNEEWKQKYDALTSPESTKTIQHSSDFWTDLSNNCAKKTGPFGSDAIKRMIKTGKMTVHDTDRSRFNRTVLIMATDHGAYDLTQFLINNV